MQRQRSAISLGGSVFLLLIALLLPEVSYSEATTTDCTYDQNFPKQFLRDLARKHKHSRLDLRNGTLSFSDARKGKIQVNYAGCDHLGFQVSRRTDGTRQHDKHNALAEALQLAADYGDHRVDQLALDDLKKGIAGHLYQEEKLEEEKVRKVIYSFPSESGMQIEVVEEVAPTWRKVTTSLSRNF